MLLEDNSKLKNYILKEYNQVEIFAQYLDIPESDIEYCLLNKSNKINNLHRGDEHPSLGFMYVIDKETGENKLKMYDFADPKYRGDCFELVKMIKHIPFVKGLSFINICKDIIKTMQSRTIIAKPRQVIEVKEKECSTISIEGRLWTVSDINYWKKQGFSYEEIKTDIIPVQNAYFNDKLIYIYNASDPCYHYITGYYKSKVLRKLYFPKRSKKDKRGRFVTNNGFFALEGLHELRKADILVITKSYKDRKLLKKIIKQLSLEHTIEITNFTAETFPLSNDLIKALFNTYPNVIINTDFDYAGVTAANIKKNEINIRKKYNIHYYFLTNGTRNTIDYGGKDISDICANKGYQHAKHLVHLAYLDFIENHLSNLNLIDNEIC